MLQAVKQSALVVACGIVMALGASAQVTETPTTFSGSTAVGSTSQPVTVTLSAQVSGQITAFATLTGGSANLDFAIASEGTCSGNPGLTAGQSCTLSVVFAPLYPGVRQGAVLAMSGSQVLASAPLSGMARGSLPVLVPGTINTVAGDAEWIYQRDGVAATSAPIFLPSGIAVDAAGNLHLCDSSNNRVRRVDARTGLISTVAGNGSPGASGDGGLATAAQLNDPSGIVIDGAGNLYIADSGNNVVRLVNANSGVISTFAGQINANGFYGNGVPANSALLAAPRGLALTPGGDLVIADSGNNAVRMVNIASGNIFTVAGTGAAGYNGEGAATSAELNDPYGVAVRSDGAIAIADLENQRVRLVTTQNNASTISTLTGTGERGFGGDNGTPSEAQLNSPAAVVFDPAGDLFIADSGNNRIRVILNSSQPTIQSVIGTDGEQFDGDGGPSSQASLYGPYGLFFDPTGNIWLADTFHNRVREVNGSLLTLPQFPTMKVGKISAPVMEWMYNPGNGPLLLSTPILNQAALDEGTTTCGQSPIAPSGSCSMAVEFAPTQTGPSVTGSISWPSNAPHETPLDIIYGEVLSVDVTSVSLSGRPNPGLLTQPLTLTATVSSDDTGRIGTITFSEGSYNWCTAVGINAGGTATCTIQALSLGSHTFTASYSGDANNASSISLPYVEVIKQQPALAFSVSPSPSAIVASTVTLTLTVADASGTPAGNVVFYDGGTALGSVPLSASGMAQLSQGFSVGTHYLSAQYTGDSATAAATSTTVTERINQATTVTTLASSAGTSIVGTPVTLTTTVTNNNGSTPTGYVTLKDGTAILGSHPLGANGVCSISTSMLSPGTHSVVAVYSGDTNDSVSSSTALTETIVQIATVTTLGTNANPLSAGATLRLTAAVILAPGETAYGPLTGSATFYDGATAIGPGPVAINANGQAILSIATLAVGSHALTARFNGDTDHSASNSVPLSQAVQETSTQTVLTSSASTALMGKPAIFTVVVTSASGIPTGQVSFRDGPTQLGSVRLGANGTASFAITTLSRGAHAITAVYSGDSDYTASVSPAVALSVQLAQPVLTLGGPTNAIDAGTPATFVANLTTPGIAPTGTLLLLDGAIRIGAATITGSTPYSFSIATLLIGTHTVTASYAGDINNTAATSAPVTVTIRQALSTTALAASANPLTLGNPLTLTATVSSGSPNAGGPVRFFDGPVLLGTSALGNHGTASFSPAGLALGSHSLTVVYSGDTNHGASGSTPLSVLVVQAATVTLNSNNNPSASGQSVTFTAQIGPGGTIAASGIATFHDNGVLIVTVPLNGGGAAILTSSALAVGSHIITVSYGGDQHFSTSSAQLVQTIRNANTQLTITSSANPAVYKQPLTLTATVMSDGGTATGNVTFTDAGAPIGSGLLNAAGVASLTLSTLAPGAHAIVANYPGDGKAEASASTPLSLTVKQTTAVAVSAGSNPAQTLSGITLTARVTNAGAAPATGSVVFADAGTTIGTANVDFTSNAILKLPGMNAGFHTITASYPGDGSDFASASAPYQETVQLRPTATTLAGSATDLTNPQQVTLIAVVDGQGTTPPTGTVTFTSGTVTLGQAAISPTGVATITVLFSQPTSVVVATYPGDANYAASQSGNTTIAAGTAPQFTLSANAQSITLVSHQHTMLQVNIGSVKGFSDTIALGCLGLPQEGTCTFTPSQLKLAANGTATASLLVDTGDPLGAGTGAAARSNTRPLRPGGDTFLCFLPFGLFLGLLAGKKGRAARQRLGMMCMLAVAIAFAVGVSGCGGLNTTGTAPGTYTIKVVGTAQGSGITETQTITLVVTQ